MLLSKVSLTPSVSNKKHVSPNFKSEVDVSPNLNTSEEEEELLGQDVRKHWEIGPLLFAAPYHDIDFTSPACQFYYLQYACNGLPDRQLVGPVRQAYYQVLARLNHSELQVKNFILPVQLMKLKYIDPYSRQRIIENICRYLSLQTCLRSVVLEEAEITFADLCRFLLALNVNSHIRKLYLWGVLKKCETPFTGPLQMSISTYDYLKLFITKSMPLKSLHIDNGFCPTLDMPQLMFFSVLKFLYLNFKETLEEVSFLLWHSSGRIDSELEKFIKEAPHLSHFEYYGPLQYKSTISKLCDAALLSSSAVQVYGAPQYLYQDLDQDNGLQQAQLQALQAQLESLQGQPLYDGPDDDGSLVRNRRLTCDVFSFQSQWITPNHAACALKCAAQFWKYKGGRCVNGNCHCTPRG